MNIKKHHILIASGVILALGASYLFSIKRPAIKELLVDVTVFPSGWFADPEGAQPSPSATLGGIRSEERTTLFFHSIIGSASEEIERFKNNSQATQEFFSKKAWEFREDKEIGVFYIPNELPYHSTVADQYYFSCVDHDAYPYPFLGCSYLAQYGEYTVTFRIAWKLDVMSFSELEEVLLAIDEKMSPYTE